MKMRYQVTEFIKDNGNTGKTRDLGEVVLYIGRYTEDGEWLIPVKDFDPNVRSGCQGKKYVYLSDALEKGCSFTVVRINKEQ